MYFKFSVLNNTTPFFLKYVVGVYSHYSKKKKNVEPLKFSYLPGSYWLQAMTVWYEHQRAETCNLPDIQ